METIRAMGDIPVRSPEGMLMVVATWVAIALVCLAWWELLTWIKRDGRR